MSLKEIWVVATGPTDLAKGARGLAEKVNAISFGASLAGADLTLVLPEAPEGALIEDYAQQIADLLAARGAKLVLFDADVRSRLLAGTVAARLGASPRNAVELGVADGVLSVGRMAYGGLAVALERIASPTAVLVVGPGTLPAVEDYPGAGEVEEVAAAIVPSGMRVLDIRPKAGETVNLASAKRVVGVGRGFAAEADLELARRLAAKIGAELACSRPIAEGVNWLPTERYIGVSGLTLRPDLYIAVGISGQIQHLVGVNKAKTLIAVNKDKNAPIFKQVDAGIVGDLYEVLPALIEAL
ncbi:MAG: FAD-binding protein [Propionibacteriaceae bacterium]|nr:FAD-binding protein [Propionibacteriaceae bacterium]